MKIARIAALFLFAGISIAARAEEAKPATADKPTFHASKTSTVTSKVKSVNQKTRMVTLVNDAGEEVTFKADQRIKNLKQLKKGDVVTATVTETLSARVLNPGETPTAAASGSTVASAPLGAKPAGYAAKEVYVVATIAAIDKDNMIVTLKNAQGEAFPVKAREKKNVEKLAVGDNIEIHATQSLAVEVTTPKKK
jgi:TusA-related sulfurtransferase